MMSRGEGKYVSRFYIPLEELHSMIDTLDQELKRLAQLDSKFTDFTAMAYVPDAVSVLHNLRMHDAFPALGMSSSLLTQLLNFNAKIRTATLVAALERTRTFLRSQESEYRGFSPTTDEQDLSNTEGEDNPAITPAPVAVWTEQWIYVQPRSRAKQIIVELSDLLEEVLLLASQSNLPEEYAALSKIDRQQLIALLETALSVLKSPMVEPGLLKKLRKVALDVGQSAATKQAELVLGGLSTAAAALIAKLLGLL